MFCNENNNNNINRNEEGSDSDESVPQRVRTASTSTVSYCYSDSSGNCFYVSTDSAASDDLELEAIVDVVLMAIDCEVFEPQSGIEQDYALSETMKSQNVRFSDQYNGPTTMISGRKDPIRAMTDTKDTALQNFFSRPVKIYEQTWSVGAGIDVVIDPWNLYFTDSRVENRITTYNLLRADLHVKVVVNGNGFYYGRAVAAYGPFDTSTYDSLSLTTTLADFTQWSQRPKVFIDPTNSMGGEMVIPFHEFQNNCWVQNAGWSDLGQLWLRSINSLAHANGGTDPLTVSVFAWAENVELSVLTSMDVGSLSPQSGVEVDEANEKGVVSGPASAVSKYTGMLSNMPVIGPYATATSKAAGAAAELAKLFGYCRPPLTKAPEPYRPTAVSSLANTTVPDVVNKLTVDDKQELTIDPVVCGIGDHDPMDIAAIASRESYLTTFSWPMSTSAEGITKSPTTGLLWNCRVDPCVWNATGSAYLFPACAAAALPFEYWTGKMKFRFQIVCSAFHKGRIKIVYDPNQVDSNEYNTNYLKVIDIADEQDVTVEVGVGQPETLMKHAEPGIDLVTNMYNTTPLTYNDQLGNGVLSVFVVNELTSPNSTAANDIEINVYVSMGDDFEVFVPHPHFQNFVFKPQSGVELRPQSGMEDRNTSTVPESEHTDEPNAPIQKKSENIAVPSYTLPVTNLMFTGESIRSFRTMLKRYNRWMTFGPGNIGNACFVNLEAKAFPALRGNVAGAIHSTAAAAPYNFVNTVLLHWLTYMFSGWRGGIRYKVIPKRGVQYCDITASRHSANGGAFSLSSGSYSAIALSSSSEIAASTVLQGSTRDKEQTGHEGLAFTTSKVNPVLEFEVPWYSRYRFAPGKTQNWSTGTDDFCQFYSVFINQIFDRPDLASTVGCYDLFVAAGEDFQVFLYTGLPRMYYEPVPPAPLA